MDNMKNGNYTNNQRVNSKSIIILRDLPSDDPTHRKPSIEKAKQILNWEPKVDREQGLIKTINYFKGVINA
jgi:nucleoside-diphosphate-sugar epimerase